MLVMEQWKRNLTILCIALFLVMAAWSSIIPFLPMYLKQDLGVLDDKAVKLWTGVIYGASFLSMMIVSPFWGKLGDRYGRKIMIIRSGLGLGTVILLMGLARSPGQLLALRLINGTISGFNPAAVALISINSPPQRVGFALGTLNSAVVGGSIFGPVLGGLMAELVGVRHIFFFTGLVLFAATLLVAFFVHETNKPDQEALSSSMSADAKVIFSTSPLPALFTTGMLIQFALLSTNPFLPIFIEELNPGAHLTSILIGVIVSLAGVASVAFSPIFGRLGDKFGPARILFYSLIAAALALLPHVWVKSYLQVSVCRFLFGMAVAGLLPTVNTLIRQYAPPGKESSTYGYSNSFFNIGMLLGPITGGFFAGMIGIRGVFVFSACLFFINALWFKAHMMDKRISPQSTEKKPEQGTTPKP